MLSKNGYGLVDGYNRWRNTRHEVPPVPFPLNQVSIPAGILRVGAILGFTHAQGPPNAYTVIYSKDRGVKVFDPGIFRLEGAPGEYSCYYVDSSERLDTRALNVNSREGYQLKFSLSYSYRVIQPDKVIFINPLNRLLVAVETAAKNIARDRSHDTLYPVGSDTQDYSALSRLILDEASRYPITQLIQLTELTVTDVIGDPDRIHAFLHANLKNTEIEQESSYIEKERDLELKRIETEWMLQNERDEIRKVVAERDAEIFNIQLPARLLDYQLNLREKYSDQIHSIIEKSFDMLQNAGGAQGGYLNAYGIQPETIREPLYFADRALQRMEEFNTSLFGGVGPELLEFKTAVSRKAQRNIYAEMKELQEYPGLLDVQVVKKNGGNFNIIVAFNIHKIKLEYDVNNPRDLLSVLIRKNRELWTLGQEYTDMGAEYSIREFLLQIILPLIYADKVEEVATPSLQAKASKPNGSNGSGVRSIDEAEERSHE